MKKVKITLIALIILLNTTLISGCWNYREVNELAIVAGVAVDKEKNGLYTLTVEIVKISGRKDTKISSKIITMEGKTMFDAVRNGISLSNEKLYWSHAKVIILSKEIASEGVIKVLDWYARDSETRPDMHILISKEPSAKEIFIGQRTHEEVKSFVLDNIIKNQKNLSKAPIIDILQFDNDLQAKGISAIAPSVTLKQTDGKNLPYIMGTAIFKQDRLVGFLNSDETKHLMFIRNKIKGGLLTEIIQEKNIITPVTLEIFNNKTQMKPNINGNDIIIDLNINTTVTIDEIGGTQNLIDDEGRLKLEQSTEKMLKKQIESLIKKVQVEYDTDIFGFGVKLRENNLIRVSDNWNDKFKNLKVNVTTKVHIRNSSLLSKPLEEND